MHYNAKNHLLNQARTNVPGLSERTLQRDIAHSSITLDARIQVCLRTNI